MHNHRDALHVLVCVPSQLATGGPSRGLSLVSRVAPAALNVLIGARGSAICDGFYCSHVTALHNSRLWLYATGLLSINWQPLVCDGLLHAICFRWSRTGWSAQFWFQNHTHTCTPRGVPCAAGRRQAISSVAGPAARSPCHHHRCYRLQPHCWRYDGCGNKHKLASALPSKQSACDLGAVARPEGVNRPELLPKGEVTPVIDVAGFLTPSEVRTRASCGTQQCATRPSCMLA